MRRHEEQRRPARARAPFAAVPAAILGAIALSAAAEPAHAAAPSHYDVQPGDTVSQIAARHGLRTGDLLAANGLGWSSVIHPGQRLHLEPATGAPAPVAAPAPPPSAPAAAHEIRPGDTISGIARAHGVSTQAVLDANGLTAASIIYPGQTVAIPSAAPAAARAPAAPGLDAEQAANAQLIVRVGREAGVPERGIAIALGTAMQESWLRNIDWGDRDSLGLFQQRPATGWGTPAEIMDPVRSTKAFYGGGVNPNGFSTRGLLDIPGWESMSYADAAQAVQISAYPDRYARWEQPAYTWLAAVG